MSDQPPIRQRREFLKRVGGAAFSWASVVIPARAAGAPLPNPVGYATISWPESEFDEALVTISHLHFKGVQMLGRILKVYGNRPAALKEKLQSLKLEPAALSAWGVRLNPAQLPALEDETEKFRTYADFQRRLGGLYLQVTDGGNPHSQYSADQIKALGERMNALGKIAKERDLQMGYHPHFGTLGETREGLGRVLDATDSDYVKLIADVAHLTLGGSDPAEVIRTYYQRLVFCHFKDLRKDVAKLARQNRDLVRHSRYHFCEIGQGVVDFPAILEAFRDMSFKGWVIVELDGYEVPPGGPGESARTNAEAMKQMGFQV